MQATNPTFYYTMEVNDNGTLRHVFWIDGRSRTACSYFSDVICFDTTYLTNTYQMSFAPFVGVNHHGQSIILGCALLSNERIESFIWVFNCWMKANGGVHPNAIITDQDKAMEAAIAQVFPNTRHRFCLWHILKKIPEKIGHICNAHLNFMYDFDECIYDSISSLQFNERWEKMMGNYASASKNEWLKGLYDCRAKWAPVFLKDTFFAVAIERRFDAENQADVKSWETEAYLKTSSPYEKQAADIYTRAIFQKFQQELIEVAACHPIKVDVTSRTFRILMDNVWSWNKIGPAVAD
ncbi:hypothetical protein Taro_050195 [Colocasia esculenta]|uniref:Protein FAR1-RELATED SEQUENCE n=1 Tax=Colocasia esculenta TaxID=4460 RepID=A0A843XD33_COLES|nr:hypothetical protein [Colocasia esculenta]